MRARFELREKSGTASSIFDESQEAFAELRPTGGARSLLFGAVVHGMETSACIGPTSFARRGSRGAASNLAVMHGLEATRPDRDARVAKVAEQTERRSWRSKSLSGWRRAIDGHRPAVGWRTGARAAGSAACSAGAASPAGPTGPTGRGASAAAARSGAAARRTAHSCSACTARRIGGSVCRFRRLFDLAATRRHGGTEGRRAERHHGKAAEPSARTGRNALRPDFEREGRRTKWTRGLAGAHVTPALGAGDEHGIHVASSFRLEEEVEPSGSRIRRNFATSKGWPGGGASRSTRSLRPRRASSSTR